jgi:hypothetical protein
MALGVDLTVIRLADQDWCFEIHHTLSVYVPHFLHFVKAVFTVYGEQTFLSNHFAGPK